MTTRSGRETFSSAVAIEQMWDLIQFTPEWYQRLSPALIHKYSLGQALAGLVENLKQYVENNEDKACYIHCSVRFSPIVST